MSVDPISDEAHLARAVVAALRADARALADLQHLITSLAAESETALAYTVASLAAALCVSPKVVRNAIARGELEADAVARWAGATPRSTARLPAHSSRYRGHHPLRDSYANAVRP